MRNKYAIMLALILRRLRTDRGMHLTAWQWSGIRNAIAEVCATNPNFDPELWQDACERCAWAGGDCDVCRLHNQPQPNRCKP